VCTRQPVDMFVLLRLMLSEGLAPVIVCVERVGELVAGSISE